MAIMRLVLLDCPRSYRSRCRCLVLEPISLHRSILCPHRNAWPKGEPAPSVAMGRHAVCQGHVNSMSTAVTTQLQVKRLPMQVPIHVRFLGLCLRQT